MTRALLPLVYIAMLLYASDLDYYYLRSSFDPQKTKFEASTHLYII